jgi:hypothetical protein
MWQVRLPFRVRADVLALQSNAELAGLAMACAYSSSAEFEAAVINSRLRAGAYGSRRRVRQMLYAAAATAGVLATSLMLMVG